MLGYHRNLYVDAKAKRIISLQLDQHGCIIWFGTSVYQWLFVDANCVGDCFLLVSSHIFFISAIKNNNDVKLIIWLSLKKLPKIVSLDLPQRRLQLSRLEYHSLRHASKKNPQFRFSIDHLSSIQKIVSLILIDTFWPNYFICSYSTWNFGYWESRGIPGPKPKFPIGTITGVRLIITLIY